MKIFVTGGTGFIGSLVVDELIGKGHRVLGLARSDKAEQALKAAGADVIRGELEDTQALKRAAAQSDGVVHLGFSSDFSRYNEAVAMDLAAVQAIGSALEGTGKPFVNTAGTLGVSGLGRTATEADLPPQGMPRGASEEHVIALASKGVRSSVVRLAPCVHDVDRHGLASMLGQIAAEKGLSAYIGEGENMWPAVHRRDAAHLFCLALESAPAGSRLNAVAEEGIPMREIAQAIGRNLNIPSRASRTTKRRRTSVSSPCPRCSITQPPARPQKGCWAGCRKVQRCWRISTAFMQGALDQKYINKNTREAGTQLTSRGLSVSLFSNLFIG